MYSSNHLEYLVHLVRSFVIVAVFLTGIAACDDHSEDSADILCGNGMIDAGEECDPKLSIGSDCSILGYRTGVLRCTHQCTYDVSSCVSSSCGDGVVDSGEECDDGTGNSNEPNACREDCKKPYCGDGVVDSGEECDDGTGNSNEPNACRVDCRLPACGDGIMDSGEVCDDGNTQSGDGCSADCHSTEVCGNGITDVNEECDDGNDVDWDGCKRCTVSEFQVNEYTDGYQSFPSVAMAPDGRLVVVWQSMMQDGDTNGIYAQVYDASGNPVGGEFRVNSHTIGSQNHPRVAMAPDGRFMVVWSSGAQDSDGSTGIYAQMYSANGTPDGTEFSVNTYVNNTQDAPDVAAGPDGSFIVVWESWGQDGEGYGIYGQRYGSDGSPVGSEFQVNTSSDSNQQYPRVTVGGDGRFVVVWQGYDQYTSSYDIYGQRYSSDGSPVGGEFRVNTQTDQWQQHPVVAAGSDSSFVVVWESHAQDGSADGIYGQRYSSDGSPVGSEFRVNTYTQGSQSVPSVAMAPDGRFVVVWTSEDQDGDSYGNFAQRFDAQGNLEGSEFQVNVYTNNEQWYPDVVMGSDGRFVVVWTSVEQDGSYGGIFAQRYTPDGTPIGLNPMP